MTARQPMDNKNQKDSKLDFSVRLMEHLIVPTFVLDADCRVVIWNRACERLTGVQASEVIGSRDQWRAFYNEPRTCLADLIALGRTDEINALYDEHDRVGKDAVFTDCYRVRSWIEMPRLGERIYLTADAGPIYDEAGKLVAVVETLRDMSAQKRAQEELERLATRDGLTSVANRRSFDETLNTEWRRASRESRALSLLMIDVDYFKPYNDTYGHQSGDDCLRQIAAAMTGVVKRASDCVARYGGEEFSILMPATELGGARIVAERIRAAVEALRLPHSGSAVAEHVTVSIGVACMHIAAGGEPAAQLIAAADAALYRAKHAGRNRIELAETPV